MWKRVEMWVKRWVK